MLTKLLRIFSICSLVVYLTLKFYCPVEFEDIWWHLATGRWIVEHGSVPQIELFSFLKNPPQHISTQWLGSSLFYLVYQATSVEGLKVFRCLMLLCAIVIFCGRYLKKLPLAVLMMMSIVLALGFEHRIILRPFLFNFIFIQLLLIILIDSSRNNSLKMLLWIPLIGLIWSNIHLGSLVYGVLLIAVFILESMIQGIRFMFVAREKEKAQHSLKRLSHLSVILLVYLISFTLGPYGLKGLIYPLKVTVFPLWPGYIQDPGIFNLYELRTFIRELRSPIDLLNVSKAWVVAMFLTGGLISFFAKDRNRLSKMLLFIFSLFIYLSGERGLPFFTIINCYIIAEYLASDSVRKQCQLWKHPKLFHQVTYVFVIMFTIICSWKITSAHDYVDGKTLKRYLLAYDAQNPMPAVDMLKENHITGAVLNESRYGGYLLWSSYPELRAFTDSRQYNKELMLKYIDLLKEPEKYFDQVVGQYGLNIALLDSRLASHQRLIPYIHEHPQWQLIYLKGTILVFVKKGVFHLPKNLEQFENNLIHIDVAKKEVDWLIKHLLADRIERSESLFNPGFGYIDVLEEGLILSELGYQQASMERFIKAYKIDPDSTRKIVKLKKTN